MHLAHLVLLAAQSSDTQAKAAETWTQERLETVAAEIQGQIEELRGQKFLKPVSVKLTDEKGLTEYVAQREKVTESPGRRLRDEVIAKLLGLMPPEMDLDAIELKFLKSQAAGFYDPTSKCFYLMDKFAHGATRIIMSHELTHALDDQLYDIDATLKKANEETDGELAVRCVAEGSGTNAMYQWLAKHPKDVSMADLIASQGDAQAVMLESPACIWKPALGSYMRGDGFLVKSGGLNIAQKGAKSADVARAFRDPPRSTEQILHPAKYWDEKKRDDPKRVRIDATKLGAEGWSSIGEDTLGEMMLAIVTSPAAQRKGLDMSNPMAAMAVTYTNTAAEGWGGDRVVVFEHGDERFLELATEWDTAKDAEEFNAAITSNFVVFDGPRDVEHGWRAGLTPTWIDVSLKAPTTVVVRIASTSSADRDRALAQIVLPTRVEETPNSPAAQH